MRSASRLKVGLALLVGKFAEDLGEIGGMLLLQQVQQVGGRTNAQQSLDRVEDEIDSPLRRHGEGSSVTGKQLNLTRDRATSASASARR